MCVIISLSSHHFFSLDCLPYSHLYILGTGTPLSIFCHSSYSCLFFILFINPTICFFGAINKARREQKTARIFSYEIFIVSVSKYYEAHLLHPDVSLGPHGWSPHRWYTGMYVIMKKRSTEVRHDVLA